MAQYTNTSNKLIVRESPRINAIHTEANHIQKMAQADPFMFEDTMIRTFHSMRLYANPIQELTQGRKIIKNISRGESDTWKWKQTIAQRPAYVVENLESTNSTPGIRKQRFKLKLNEDWFSPGDVITPDRINQVRVVPEEGAKYTELGGTVYICEYLDGGNANAFLPTKFLAPGVEWGYLYNVHGEGASLASGVHMDGNIELQDTLGDMQRFTASTTGYVEDMVLNMEIYDFDPATGERGALKGFTWMNKVEAKLWRTVDKSKWDYLFYGVGDSNLTGEKTKKVRTNFGFKYQLENWSNTESYNTLSSTLLREYIMDLFIGKIEPSQINVEFVGGIVAELAFDEALKRDTSNFVVTEKTVLSGSNQMDMTYGWQVKTYLLPGGGRIRFRRINFPDTGLLNSMRDSSTGRPIESGHLYVFNLSGELSNNLAIVQRPDNLRYGYVSGTGSPFANGGILSMPDDIHTFYIRTRCSPWIQDISNCGVLKWKPL